MGLTFRRSRGIARVARLLVTATATAFLLSLSSCNYVADRGLDFLDQYRFVAGAGSQVGIRSSSLGLWDTGLMFGLKPRATSIGWKYGVPFWLDENDSRIEIDQAEIVRTTSILGMDYAQGSYEVARQSWAVVPALLTWVDSTPTDYEWRVPDESDEYDDFHWLWSPYAFENVRYAQIHAFDSEFEIALLLYLDVGYSIGELADFFLGIVFIDIAKDDHRL